MEWKRGRYGRTLAPDVSTTVPGRGEIRGVIEDQAASPGIVLMRMVREWCILVPAAPPMGRSGGVVGDRFPARRRRGHAAGLDMDRSGDDGGEFDEVAVTYVDPLARFDGSIGYPQAVLPEAFQEELALRPVEAGVLPMDGHRVVFGGAGFDHRHPDFPANGVAVSWEDLPTHHLEHHLLSWRLVPRFGGRVGREFPVGRRLRITRIIPGGFVRRRCAPSGTRVSTGLGPVFRREEQPTIQVCWQVP